MTKINTMKQMCQLAIDHCQALESNDNSCSIEVHFEFYRFSIAYCSTHRSPQHRSAIRRSVSLSIRKKTSLGSFLIEIFRLS